MLSASAISWSSPLRKIRRASSNFWATVGAGQVFAYVVQAAPEGIAQAFLWAGFHRWKRCARSWATTSSTDTTSPVRVRRGQPLTRRHGVRRSVNDPSDTAWSRSTSRDAP